MFSRDDLSYSLPILKPLGWVPLRANCLPIVAHKHVLKSQHDLTVLRQFGNVGCQAHRQPKLFAGFGANVDWRLMQYCYALAARSPLYEGSDPNGIRNRFQHFATSRDFNGSLRDSAC